MNDRPSPPSLRLDRLSVFAGARHLLDESTIEMPGGKITIIVGGSGAGKSVLLRTLAGLNPMNGPVVHWTGKIDLAHESNEQSTDSQNVSLARRVGIVFQQFALFDELSPLANVQFAIDHRAGRRDLPTPTSRQWLDELGVPSDTQVSALSGGQKQRLAIARTLAANPHVILYDEPTSGLDSASGKKVAELIRETHEHHHRTSIIVTHDYQTLLPIADDVLLLDSKTKKIIRIPRNEWSKVAERMEAVSLPIDKASADRARPSLFSRLAVILDHALVATGSSIVASMTLPRYIIPVFPRLGWGLRFTAHYLRLVGGPSAWVYLILAGLIVGFTGTYFTFRFLPFRLYTQPLLVDELLSSIGFALYRILVPVLATILIAARCGAAVAADVGVKKYGGQVDALQTLGVRPASYLLCPIVIAFVIATPLLETLAFTAARTISLFTFTVTHPSMGPYFWQQHFYRNLQQAQSWMYVGWSWVLAKNLACGIGTAAIGYYRGMQEKNSAVDVSHSITSTVLWTTLYVLVVHFIMALFEF